MISKYKGISWDKRTKKWESVVTVDGIRHACGYFDSDVEAVKARDKRLIALGADYSKLQILKPLNR
jgi:hypothetical protein